MIPSQNLLLEDTRRILLAWGRRYGGDFEKLAYEIANQIAAIDYDADNHAARAALVKNARLLVEEVNRAGERQ